MDRAWQVAELSAAAGISISYEKHGGTLTETTESCARLLDETNHPAIFTLWQPAPLSALEDSLGSLASVVSRLRHLHVFYWEAARQSLDTGKEFWLAHLELLQRQRPDLDLLLEYVPHDDPAILSGEAATLREWIAAVS